MSYLKPYYSVWRLRFINGLQYRAAALAGLATQFFFGMILIMIFVAFYSQSRTTQPISLKDLVSYVWLQQAFLAFVVLWFRDNDIFQLITSGNIAYELCRPSGIYELWFAKLLAQRLSAAAMRCVPVLLIAFLLPKTYRMSLPPSLATLAVFVFTLLLGLLVLVSISMLIYISVFWTMSPIGSILMVAVVGDFFSGLILPIPLMPSWLQTLAYLLPFRLSADLPFRVYSGQIPMRQALWGGLIQIVWLTALIGIGKFSMQKALRQVVVQGG